MTSIQIDLEAKTPPFEQIKASITGLIAAGTLAEGHKLPPIRQLAGDLGVAPNTVARAYRELEGDGLIRSRGRRGTVVLPAPPTSQPVDAIAAAVDDARARGMSAAEILSQVAAALAR